uniref:MLO-like protein n=1 Tax=Strongyloides papillosus TaxID=174720 RepID=A0A0N5C2V4_STREA
MIVVSGNMSFCKVPPGIEDPTDLCSQCVSVGGTTDNKKKEIFLFVMGLLAPIVIKFLSTTTYGKKILEWIHQIGEHFPDTGISEFLRSAAVASTAPTDTTTTMGDDKEIMEV